MSISLDLDAAPSAVGVVQLTYRDAIKAALEDELASDPAVLLLGEDVGCAGGVFKTSEGLHERFGGDRVLDTPICENGFLGMALGMAITGLRPVVEIMFSDFLPSAGDALYNELPKYRFMSGGQCSVPVTVRSIGGGGGRMGTQHSATGESWFIGLPGLKIATAGTPASAYGVLRAAIRENDPVIFFEHKALYGKKGDVRREAEGIVPVGRAAVLREGTDITVVSTLMMTDRSLQAADRLAANGISVEVIELRWLRPLDYETILASVGRTGRLMIVEEQVHVGGWGASVISRIAAEGVSLQRPAEAVSLPDNVLIPYAPTLEDAIIPSVETIVARARQHAV